MSKAMVSSKPRVRYKDLREHLRLLETAGLLHKITAEVAKGLIDKAAARRQEFGSP